jgi:hypothetical protein
MIGEDPTETVDEEPGPEFDTWLIAVNQDLLDSLPDGMSPAQFRDQITRQPLSELYAALPEYLDDAAPYDVEAGLARLNAWIDEQEGKR